MDENKTPEITVEQAVTIAKESKGRQPRAIRTIIKVKDAEGKETKVEKVSRLDLFLAEYLKNGYHGTKAAQKALGIKNYWSAAKAASELLSQAKILGRIILEEKGIGYVKLIEHLGKQAINPEIKDTVWWDRAMKISGGEDFISKQNGPTSVSVSINQAQKKTRDEFGFSDVIEGEEVSDATPD